MIYYAITIKDNVITGVHESALPIGAETFAGNPWLREHEVRAIESGTDYQAGRHLAEYAGGKLRPLTERIKEGLAEVPPNHELIGGELVKTDAPPDEEKNPGVARMIQNMADEIFTLKEEIRAFGAARDLHAEQPGTEPEIRGT